MMYQDKPGMFHSFFEAVFYLGLFILACFAIAGVAGMVGALVFELISNAITGRF